MKKDSSTGQTMQKIKIKFKLGLKLVPYAWKMELQLNLFVNIGSILSVSEDGSKRNTGVLAAGE